MACVCEQSAITNLRACREENWASQVALVVKNPPVKAGTPNRHMSKPWLGKIPWRRAWQPTPAFLPGESYGQRSLAGCSP